jgi:hypothetical protein
MLGGHIKQKPSAIAQEMLPGDYNQVVELPASTAEVQVLCLLARRLSDWARAQSVFGALLIHG